MVCIAGGSGMSAVKAVLEQAAIDQVERDAVFLFGARSQKDTYSQKELEEIQKKWNPNFKFEYVYVSKYGARRFRLERRKRNGNRLLSNLST